MSQSICTQRVAWVGWAEPLLGGSADRAGAELGLHVEPDGGRGGRTRTPLGRAGGTEEAGTCPAFHLVRSGHLSQAIRCLMSVPTRGAFDAAAYGKAVWVGRVLDWEPETPRSETGPAAAPTFLRWGSALSRSMGAGLNILRDFLWLACATAIQGQLLSGTALCTLCFYH